MRGLDVSKLLEPFILSHVDPASILRPVRCQRQAQARSACSVRGCRRRRRAGNAVWESHAHLCGGGRPDQRVQDIRHGGALAGVRLDAPLDQVRHLRRHIRIESAHVCCVVILTSHMYATLQPLASPLSCDCETGCASRQQPASPQRRRSSAPRQGTPWAPPIRAGCRAAAAPG